MTHDGRTPHITVCVCTYKRPQLLEELLGALQRQRTDNRFTYSVVIADNDVTRSAEPIVRSCLSRTSLRIDYHVEPDRNIALARNKAVRNATGDYVAFIDDDEVPVDHWLVSLFEVSLVHEADAILGPVVPQYVGNPPSWLIQCGFLERPRYKTGTILPWNETRTGNVLLAMHVFDEGRTMFRPEFRHSEDGDFFKRIIANGRRVIWCDEAVVYEIQGADRFKIGYFIKRSLLRGNVSLRLFSNKPLAVLKSAVALAIYTVSLPFLALIRRDLAIVYLVRNFDHIGRIMAACRIDLQKPLAHALPINDRVPAARKS